MDKHWSPDQTLQKTMRTASTGVKISLAVVLFLLLGFPDANGGMEQSINYLDNSCGPSSLDDDAVYYPNRTVPLADRLFLSSSIEPNATNSFYHTSAKTYTGLSFCWANVQVERCRSCVIMAVETILWRCADNFEFGQIWYDICMVGYKLSHSSFDSSIYLELESSKLLGLRETEYMKEYIPVLIQEAALGNSSLMFVSKTFYVNDDEKRYGSAQCSRDIGVLECLNCLNSLFQYYLSEFGKSGNWWLLSLNCTIRYGDTPLYVVDPSVWHDPVAVPGKQRVGKKSAVIIGLIVSLMVLNAVLACGIYYLRPTNRTKKDGPQPHQETRSTIFYNNTQFQEVLNESIPTIPLNIIKESTKQFSNQHKVGEGGFGPVYKGILPDGRPIAVKLLSQNSLQGLEEFKNEVNFIANLQHKNLVRLLGCCIEGNNKMLIYEYMSNASLDVHLFDKERRRKLDWGLRNNIIIGIAKGILYLHEGSRLKIIHRDLKAGNILLDKNMNPKISDFGLARIFKGHQCQANTQRIVGTYGYMAPEYAMEGLFSIKSDIFSFGILVLEIISGRRNSEKHFSECGENLLTHAWRLWCEGKVEMLMDPSLEKSCTKSEVTKCMHIGLLCVQEDATSRPNMSELVVMLGSDTMILPNPTKPPFSNGSNSKRCTSTEITISMVAPR